MRTLLLFILLQVTSPSVQPKHPVVRKSTRRSAHNASATNSESKLPPADSQTAGVPSTAQPTPKKDEKQQQSDERMYNIDVVSPPAKPLDTPLFPVYLVITGIGVFVNLVIACLIFRQNKINKIVANAAKQSADAVLNIERAWFFEIMELRPRAELHEPGGFTGRFGVQWHVKNYGRTPGWIVEIDGGFEKVPTLDHVPLTPNRPETFNAKFFVVVPGDDTPIFTASKTIASERGLEEEGFLCCAYGIIKYKDTFSEQIHETGFCYLYDVKSRRLVKSDKPAFYNKHT